MIDKLESKPSVLLDTSLAYSQEKAYALMELSALAYRSEDDWQSIAAEDGWVSLGMINVDDAQAGIVCNVSKLNPVAVIAFRGSSEIGDWRDDAHFCPRPVPTFPGGVCKGFYNQAVALLPGITKAIRIIKNATAGSKQPIAIYMTGHSLGGALAPLTAVLLGLKTGLMVSEVYSFESPRWCTDSAAKFYDSMFKTATKRVVTVDNGVQDLVTRIPISRWGFSHVGTPEIIDDGVRYESEAKWEAMRAARPVGILEQFRIAKHAVNAIDAHLANTVLRSLRLVGKAKEKEES